MPPKASASEPDYASLARFRHLLRRFLVFSENAARAEGLKPQQHQLLLGVKGLPADGLPTIGALAWQLQLRHHTIVGLVDRMARLGILRRVRHQQDHREVLVEVSPKGEAVLRRLSLAHRDELRRLAPQILPALSDFFHPNQKETLPCRTPLHSCPPRKENRRARGEDLATSRPRRGSSRSVS